MKKNRATRTSLARLVIDRESPGRSFRHVVSVRDIHMFVNLIPDWPTLSERLERIVLAAAADQQDGAYEFFHRDDSGAIFLHAWDKDLWIDLRRDYFDAHRFIFDRLGLSFDEREDCVTCRFTEAQAKAFTLLHVFLHELGHHFDRIHQKHRGSSRGEDYAERFAANRFEALYPKYVREFGDPSRAGD